MIFMFHKLNSITPQQQFRHADLIAFVN
uniref:Uncharacterized protein n=1 Tax=Arundo donax TaxID=35708 RepID=A0A0A8ZI73_ARUDO